MSPNWKQLSFNGWVVKEIRTDPYHRTVLSNKGKHATDIRNNLHESPENYAVMLSKRSQSQKVRCCVIPFMEH
jgi:hypothetical protein